jgi:hypothetical protein
MTWRTDPIPKELEGELLLIVLRSEDGRVEYYGDPLVVTFWGYKCKATFGEFDRIELDEIERWMPLPVEAR